MRKMVFFGVTFGEKSAIKLNVSSNITNLIKERDPKKKRTKNGMNPWAEPFERNFNEHSEQALMSIKNSFQTTTLDMDSIP